MRTFRVRLHEHKDNKDCLLFDCWADDADHATEQTENAYPNCVVVHVIPIPEHDYMQG